MTEPKPVKAWAVVDDRVNRIGLADLYFRQNEAERAAQNNYMAANRLRVIPVTIVPGHEAADLILAGVGLGPMPKSPLREAEDA